MVCTRDDKPVGGHTAAKKLGDYALMSWHFGHSQMLYPDEQDTGGANQLPRSTVRLQKPSRGRSCQKWAAPGADRWPTGAPGG
jgi:hypothetical protein